MPNRPARPCAEPGCPALTDTGRCPDHARQQKRASNQDYDRQRGSAASRGYDSRWRQIRLEQLRREPLCRHCRAEGLTAAADQVDHIIPLRRGGTHAPTNLQSLCAHHHVVKTNREDGGGANR